MQALGEDIIEALTPVVEDAVDAVADFGQGAEATQVPKVKVKRERQQAIPKDSATFFRARAKDPKKFLFTADGNLQVPEMRGEAAKVITLPFYRPATIDEKREEEEKQMDAIKSVEVEFDETAKLLREALSEWRGGGGGSDNVMKYQRDLQRLDAQRTQLRSPLRWTKTFKNLSIRDVLVNEFNEVKKLGYPVLALRTRGFSAEQMIRASDSAPALEEEEESEAEGEAEAEGEEAEAEEFVIFFNAADPDHGLLSPDTMVEFVFNSTKYNSLIQAYQAERVTMLGRKGDLRMPILKSRSPAQIRIIGSKVVGQVEDPKELWVNILKSLLSQHPRFADTLRTTGDATLVYADPRDGVLGIGIPVEDPHVTEREAWKGTNLLGQAWQAVRASLSPMGEISAPVEGQIQTGGATYSEHGTTLKEAKEQRSNVLKGFYRRNNRG
jgi:predicted NAD-dependent protein-ADP-ribosyltransferase YbiA (DUF1768 family)